ncbi:hypothetical protein, partial [Bradyrhizobium sp. HKCCYLS20291]|uniref:hypothetical protein n=1 Tax=Bradyrhizobium sp. HKCCYLS20291 TaxID=3420766 RepID=UPI003EBF13F3
TVRDDRETPLQRAGDGEEDRSDLPDGTRPDLPDGMRQTGTTGSLSGGDERKALGQPSFRYLLSLRLFCAAEGSNQIAVRNSQMI